MATPGDRIIETLDSAILPQLGEYALHHMAVGERIRPLENALGAKNRSDSRTVLQEAAYEIGRQLAAGVSGQGGTPDPSSSGPTELNAAILISDMDLEITQETINKGLEVCPGIAGVSSQYAGATFGSCFQAGVGETRFKDFYLDTFRKEVESDYSPLIVTLISTDPALGAKISEQMAARWTGDDGFQQAQLINTAAFAFQPETLGCSWSTLTVGLQTSAAAQSDACGFSCDGETGSFVMTCDLPPVNRVPSLWLHPFPEQTTHTPNDPARIESRIRDTTQLDLRFTCGTNGSSRPPSDRTRGIMLRYDWQSTPTGKLDPGEKHNNNVNALFTSFVQVLSGLVEPRTLSMGIALDDAK